MGTFSSDRRSDSRFGIRRVVSTLAGLSLAGLSILAGCNSVTGAGDLQFSGDANGAGGAGGSTESTTTTETPTPTVECVYPTMGFSTKPGGVMPNHTWQGYVNESMEVADVAMSDYYDCAGQQGINGLLIDVSATWCGTCQEEAKTLSAKMKNEWEALGIRVLTLMIEDAQSNPATIETALQWKQQYKLTTTTVGADPQFFFSQLASGGTIGLPFLVVIDPRTMTLVETQQGFPFDETKLVETAKKNQTPQ